MARLLTLLRFRRRRPSPLLPFSLPDLSSSDHDQEQLAVNGIQDSTLRHTRVIMGESPARHSSPFNIQVRDYLRNSNLNQGGRDSRGGDYEVINPSSAEGNLPCCLTGMLSRILHCRMSERTRVSCSWQPSPSPSLRAATILT